MASGFKDWDAFLLHLRNEHEARKYAVMHESHEESMAKHNQTVLACAAVDRRDWKKASQLFCEAAAELKTRLTTSVQGYHVVFVLDESSSMVGLVCAYVWLFVCVLCLHAHICRNSLLWA
jgi:hypothetical protein